MVAGNPRPGNVRRMHDFYPTPLSHVLPVIRYLDDEFPVWDPAVGDGALLRVLEHYGFVTVGSDLIDYSQGYPEMDFLDTTLNGQLFITTICQIVTNPPYRLADAFMKHALEVLCAPTVALLLPAHYLGSIKRRDTVFHKRPPSYVGVVPTRMNVPGSGVSQFYHAWFVWKTNPRHEGTLLEWL